MLFIPDSWYCIEVEERFEELKDNAVKTELCEAVRNAFFDFDRNDFEYFELGSLMQYLQKTHKFYLERRIPEIFQTIEHIKMSNAVDSTIVRLIDLIFGLYAEKLSRHIQDEEKGLFHYINSLVNNNRPANSTVLEDFLHEHDDTDYELDQLLDILKKVEVPNGRFSPLDILRSQLMIFKADLQVHAGIEEEVVLPMALSLEKGLLTTL